MKTIKAKLLVLIGVALLALLALGAATLHGLRESKIWLDEIGIVRMPSVIGLYQMKTTANEIRLNNLTAAIWENDTQAQRHFEKLLTTRQQLWKDYAQGKALYEPLPQTTEEAVLWRQFLREEALARAEEERLVDVIARLSRNTDPQVQKKLFAEFYRQPDIAQPLQHPEMLTLDKIIELNARIGDQSVKSGEESARHVTALSLAVLALALILVVLLGLYIYRSTLRQLGGDPGIAAAVARQLAGGDLRASLVLEEDAPKDSLLANIKLLMDNMEQLASRADAIGRGDFSSDVPQLSEHDRLGHAVNNMNGMLRAARAADTRRNWLKDGHSQLAAALTGDFSLQQLADTAISTLGRTLDAGRGVLYVFRPEEDALDLLGSYMYTERAHLGSRFKLGEGAIGQVAREKKPILLTTVADDAAPIVTGTSCAPPRFTYTYPLLREGHLLGVLELASHERFDDVKLELLAGITEVIASFLYIAEQREHIGKLLAAAERAEQEVRLQNEQLQDINARIEEQQQQLQQQTEELQQSNAQMEEQQQQLQQQSEELQQSNAQMEEQQQQLEQQNQELRESRRLMDDKAKQLAQASQYKSEFLANMSHELRTPLNSIILLSKMMCGEELASAEETAKWAQVIHRSGEDLLHLINDVLDLSKVEAGRMDLQLGTVASNSLQADMQEQFEHLARDKQLDFVVEDRLQGEFVTDRDKLGQILRNLLSNAFKFTKQGSVTLSISRCAGEALPIRLAVRDTGIGIADDKRAMVFEAFQQADGSTSREFGGTGLGLTISQRFAELLGGRIELQSTLGQGSEFLLCLPEHAGATLPAPTTVVPRGDALHAAPGNAAAVLTPADDRDNLLAKTPLILLIDDDAVLGQSLMLINRRLGYQTLLATNGADGLALARQYRPQGILLDLGLPDMDGAQVLHTLKCDRSLSATPVYIVSARDRDEALLRQGAAGYLQKPLDERRLAAAEALLLNAAAQAAGSAILVIERGSISAADVARLIGAAGGPVIAAPPTTVLADVIKQQACRLAIIDLGEMPVEQALDSAAMLRAAAPDIALVFFGQRAPGDEEMLRLRRYSDSVIIKTAQSEQRLLENIERFLHEVPQAAARSEPGADAASKRLAGRHILVTDDDPRNLFVLAAALEKHGARVSSAVNGRRALDFLEREPVDLIIMDIMMPEMDGYQAIAAIRKNPAWAAIPVLALSAKALPEDKARVLAAGADDYLAKPADYPTLIALTTKWCAGRRQ